MYENAIKNRYEFVLLYDVENGNPNGDPDAGNMPRIDSETGHGIVTDVCIKRKIRNYVEIIHDDEDGYNIYIRQDEPLNEKDARGLDGIGSIENQDERDMGFREWMCTRYYDIRTFGAVVTTAGKKEGKGKNADKNRKLRNVAGQIRGPVQLAFGKSVDVVLPKHISITRMAVTTNADYFDNKKSNTFGEKWVVPYALYRQEGFISANLAQKVTGFSDADLDLLWEAIQGMFEFDRSAARGKMTLRELIIFKHQTPLGNAPAHKLFELIKIQRKEGVTVPRSYSDYEVTVGQAPEGVEIIRKA
jgi:CRISPR-associated protein Csd2